jgi:hypothetical protein
MNNKRLSGSYVLDMLFALPDHFVIKRHLLTRINLAQMNKNALTLPFKTRQKQ